MLEYFADASPDPVRIDLTTMATLALTGFDHIGPTSAPDRQSERDLDVDRGKRDGVRRHRGPAHAPRAVALRAPLRGGPVVVRAVYCSGGLTAYGYDGNGAPYAKTLWHVIEPLPAQVTSLTWANLRITNWATGQQTVTLSWTAFNATSFTITGPGISVSAPAGATSKDVNLPLPPPGPTMFTLTLTANGYVIQGTSNTAVVDVYPFQLHLPFIGASATQINLGESVRLTWGAEYATGFYLNGAPFPANRTETFVKPKFSTEFIITAEGYRPGTALPTAAVTVDVLGKEITDKRLPKEDPRVQPRLLPGGLLPEDAEPDPAEPVGADGQPAGQQPFIGQDERPEMGARPRASGPTGRDPGHRRARDPSPAARCPAHGAAGPGRQPDVRLVSPPDLSVPGWTHDPANPAAGQAALDGSGGRAGAITAVLTALDAVYPADLPHVRAADRAFVAAPVAAFLRDWLATRDYQVLDPPTTLALGEWAGDRATWSAAAATLGVPDRQGTPVAWARTQTFTVAAGRITCPDGPGATGLPPGRRRDTAATAVALTRAAGVQPPPG